MNAPVDATRCRICGTLECDVHSLAQQHVVRALRLPAPIPSGDAVTVANVSLTEGVGQIGDYTAGGGAYVSANPRPGFKRRIPGKLTLRG